MYNTQYSEKRKSLCLCYLLLRKLYCQGQQSLLHEHVTCSVLRAQPTKGLALGMSSLMFAILKFLIIWSLNLWGFLLNSEGPMGHFQGNRDFDSGMTLPLFSPPPPQDWVFCCLLSPWHPRSQPGSPFLTPALQLLPPSTQGGNLITQLWTSVFFHCTATANV